jgi:hypothetical protein
MVLCLKLGIKTISKTQLLSALKTLFIVKESTLEMLETKLQYLPQYNDWYQVK